jgi:hypothetical protein
MRIKKKDLAERLTTLWADRKPGDMQTDQKRFNFYPPGKTRTGIFFQTPPKKDLAISLLVHILLN